MREFDTTIIVQPEISEEAREQLIQRYRGLLEREGAIPLEVDDMGKRKLAYEIKRFQKGHYLSLFYLDSGKAVAPLERALRIDEAILRFLTIRKEDEVTDVEARKAKSVDLEKTRHERAAERQAREAEERAAREAARASEGDGGEDREDDDEDDDDRRSRDDDDDDRRGRRGGRGGRDDDDDDGDDDDDRSPRGD